MEGNSKSRIKTVAVDSLAEFFSEEQEFSKTIGGLRCKPKDGIGVLYRGQANAGWELTTTLERQGNASFSFSKYVNFLKNLNLPVMDLLREITITRFNDDFDEISVDVLAAFSYIRHIGGPSPLIDWTESRDIALFFAFNNVANNVEYVSVFVYLDGILPGRGRCSMPGIPLIHAIPYSRIDHALTHSNHMFQKSQYTYCILGGGSADRIFVFHEGRFEMVAKHGFLQGSDLCIKFQLPIRLRQEVFKYLNGRGINEYELFKSDGAYARNKLRELFGFTETSMEKKQRRDYEEKAFLRLNGLAE